MHDLISIRIAISNTQYEIEKHMAYLKKLKAMEADELAKLGMGVGEWEIEKDLPL